LEVFGEQWGGGMKKKGWIKFDFYANEGKRARERGSGLALVYEGAFCIM